MAEHLLPEFKIIKEEPENGIRELVKIIKPHWNAENVQMEALSGGYSSKIFKCFDPKYSEEIITVRIRNLVDIIPGMDVFESQTEPQAIQYLSKVGHFPKIYAIFANGYCYEYVKGKPMMNIKIKTGSVNEKMLRSIAKEMVYIHELKLDGTDYSEEQYLQRIYLMLDLMPFKEELDPGKPTKETIKKEFEFIKEFNDSFNIPLVLAHGDCHPGNFVWNDENGKITFVDWEGACVGYRHVEVAYFIIISQIFTMDYDGNGMSLPEDFENKFLNFYFQELCKVKQQKFNEDDFQKFKELVHKCKLGPMLLFVTFPLMQMLDVVIDVLEDVPNFFEKMLDSYQKLKEEIIGTKKFNADL